MKSFLKKLFFPILKSLYNIYSSKERSYSYKGINVRVMPGVFHPGLFFSTNLLIEYLSKLDLENKTVLELGAGSGLISIYCAKQNAIVTATDINPTAIININKNVELNNVKITAFESDLFDKIKKVNYDYIIINPPYFPKDPKNEKEFAWFCGSDFKYFKKLFSQLNNYRTESNILLMILSEDCDFNRINSIANECNFKLNLVLQKKVLWEQNFIYTIE
ncbi:MAG: methyltransferase [Ignavibacteriales bacterium]|nr:methyltransferase [Ignavibacteriales bacterium]